MLPPLILPRCPYRAKSRSTVKIKDLPQGAIAIDNIAEKEDNEEPVYPTVVQQARNNMRKFDYCVLLTRVGSFYEACPVTAYTGTVLTDMRDRCILSKLRNMVHY